MKRLFLLLLLCASSVLAQDLRPSAYLGLPGKITVRGGKILGTSGGVTTIAEQTLTPANSATTYVYIDLSGTPAVATSTSAFPSSSYFPICVVTKDANGTITAFTDSRPDSFMAGAGGVSTYTVAGLPAAPATNTLAVVTDGSGASCTVGGGSTRVLCQYNGSAWVVVSTPADPLGVPTNAQTGTSYTVVTGDRASYVTFSNGSAIAVTLPQAGSTGFASNFVFVACDIGAGTATITPTTSTISYTTGLAYVAAASNMPITTGQCAWIYSDNTNYFAIQRTGGAPVYPFAVSGTVNSGGIPYFNSTTQQSSSAALGANAYVKGGGAGVAPSSGLTTDDGTTSTYTGTGGTKSPAFTATGVTAGFMDYPQGSTSAAVAPCNTATSICEQAPAAVTSYLVNKPGISATGIYTNNVSAAVITQGISGDANHSATVTIGSGTSIGSTTLCSSANCPAGTYVVNVYVDITTACGTSGTYVVNLIYTDDQGSKTVVVNLNGTGSVPATGTLTTTSTANFGENSQVLRLTSGNLNYSTTAVACGTAGPMVGKLYMAAVPVM